MKQNVLQAWKIEVLRCMIRTAAAWEDADPTQQADIQAMRPAMTRIKGLTAQASLSADARTQLLAELDTTNQRLTRIMGQGWRPTGRLAQQLRTRVSTSQLLD